MKCKYCNSTWEAAVQVKICPFCGGDLSEKDEYTISSALEKAVEDNGIEVLHNSGKIIAYIMDCVKGDDRNKKLFRIAGNTGVFDLMYEAKSCEEKSKQKILLGRAQKLLEEDAFLSHQNAVHIIEIIAEGLSLDFEHEVFPEKENEVNVHGKNTEIPEFVKKTKSTADEQERITDNIQVLQTREEYLTRFVKAILHRKLQEEERIKRERKASLLKEQSRLKEELSTLKGLFAGRRRKEIEEKISEIEFCLEKLNA